jgi:glyoxylase-like metal-dependent hydrolase (beta-lactamase superfamily II)
MGIRVERVVTSGTFTLDGESFDVDNNVWLIGNDDEVVVVDAAHDAEAVVAAVGVRAVQAILCTHAHNDHVNVAPTLAEATAADVWLHADDLPLWRQTHPSRMPDAAMSDGAEFEVGGITLAVLHTPGHTPGGVCIYAADLGTVFTGDTLFHGGPGATGRSFSDRPTLLASIRDRLLLLPPETVVRTGHGDDTTIAAEAGPLT